MEYILNRNGRFYFSRRIPTEYQLYDNRGFVRFSLKTSDKATAKKIAIQNNAKLENYWEGLKRAGSKYEHKKFQEAVCTASALGYPYVPAEELANKMLGKLLERLMFVHVHDYKDAIVHSVLGGAETPVIKVSDALERFWELAKDRIIQKSDFQKHKWRLPRKRAIEYFISCIGDKPIHEITREDVLKFKAWWLTRVENENIRPGTANKSLIQFKNVIETVASNLNITIDSGSLFKKLLLKKDKSKKLPFTTEHITNMLLNPEKLIGLNETAKWVLHAIAETGAGVTELVGLLPEDIVLDAEIPHICIRPHDKSQLKTEYRDRVIPLVGYALDAFKACPQGFPRYKDNPDSLSTVIGKYLRENDMFPTKKHTLNSLRHSFQDRILSVNTPDRIQADLMGHKFSRPVYGDGGSLDQKYEWMKKVQLKQLA